MAKTNQEQKAERFQQMHRSEGMFVIPNSWDAGSAYIYEKEGFECVATSSAGVAYALGYPDGEDITLDDLVQVVSNTVRRVDIPVSADFERGYAEDPSEVKKNARRLVEAGAVGFNIEDGVPEADAAHKLSPMDLQLAKIKALVELKQEMGIDFVINARTCAYWLSVGTPDEMMKIAIERGNAFAAAGADCVFVPGPMDEKTVKGLVSGIHAPLNTILNGRYHDFAGLEKAGVRRLSVGSGPVRYIADKVINAARDIKAGHPDEVLACTFSYGAANTYFTK
ncbi:MAG: isocitrate lyase/phosphoenolpyruvate mutase family protein [Atopobiaceae bacterium]